jgi:hypothetical protein
MADITSIDQITNLKELETLIEKEYGYKNIYKLFGFDTTETPSDQEIDERVNKIRNQITKIVNDKGWIVSDIERVLTHYYTGTGRRLKQFKTYPEVKQMWLPGIKLDTESKPSLFLQASPESQRAEARKLEPNNARKYYRELPDGTAKQFYDDLDSNKQGELNEATNVLQNVKYRGNNITFEMSKNDIEKAKNIFNPDPSTNDAYKTMIYLNDLYEKFLSRSAQSANQAPAQSNQAQSNQAQSNQAPSATTIPSSSGPPPPVVPGNKNSKISQYKYYTDSISLQNNGYALKMPNMYAGTPQNNDKKLSRGRTIFQWFKNIGDLVQENDLLFGVCKEYNGTFAYSYIYSSEEGYLAYRVPEAQIVSNNYTG